jgi:DNA (cytosine-5)-methyltransferase 1
VAFAQNTRDEVREMPYVGALAAEPGMKQTSYIRQSSAVRRLTPCECERLQGFPDDYTLVPHRGKPAADGPRYKALGNSMAVPCMAWIGQRIAAVDALPINQAVAA